MCAIALPLLYRDVDLSYHNEVGLFPSWNGMVMVEGDSPDRLISPYKSEQLRTRQNKFVETILLTPSTGSSVSGLTWTYQWDDEGWGVETETQQNMWKAFVLLDRIQRLDINSMNSSHFTVIPPNVFVTASSICLGGSIPYAFFRSMIPRPETVTSLELNNLQGFGQLRDGFNTDEYLPDDLAQRTETEDSSGQPLLRHYGALRGHLRPFIGRFTSLQRLCLRTVGQDDCTDIHWSPDREKARYTEMAAFISALRSTLIVLAFEQGYQAKEAPGFGCRTDPRRRHQVGRPMDSFFMSYLLPVVAQGSWPQLKKVIIRGVGGALHNGGYRTWEPVNFSEFKAGQEQLQTAVGGADVTWEADAKHTYYLQAGSDYFPDGPWDQTVPWVATQSGFRDW